MYASDIAPEQLGKRHRRSTSAFMPSPSSVQLRRLRRDIKPNQPDASVTVPKIDLRDFGGATAPVEQPRNTTIEVCDARQPVECEPTAAGFIQDKISSRGGEADVASGGQEHRICDPDVPARRPRCFYSVDCAQSESQAPETDDAVSTDGEIAARGLVAG